MMDYKLNALTAEYNVLVEKKLNEIEDILDGLVWALKHAEALNLDTTDMRNMIRMAELDIDTHTLFDEE
jgi:hypothetical protein